MEIVGLKPTITLLGDYAEGEVINDKKLPMVWLSIT